MGARGTRARRRKGSRRSRWSWWSSHRHLPITTDRPGPTIEIRRHWPRFSVFWHRLSHGRLFPEDAQILNGLDSAPCHRRHTHRWILGCVGVVGMSHRDPAIARCHSRGIQLSTPLLFCFLEHALGFSAWHSGGHPAAKGSASDKRLGARGRTSAIVWSRLKRGGHENAAPAALQVGLGL